jgi:hypothetical protein
MKPNILRETSRFRVLNFFGLRPKVSPKNDRLMIRALKSLHTVPIRGVEVGQV